MTEKGIILIGMAGVGKSTIGVSLARVLDFSFIDVDRYIEEKEGKKLQQIIDDQGDKALLELEKHRMYEVELAGKVVAPGGSIIYHADLMEHLKQSSVLVYLHDSLENIEEKLGGETGRGIVGLKDKSLRQIYQERTPLYAECADITINCPGKSMAQIVEEIRRRYTEFDKLSPRPD
ncbi:MAG: shikimate kinase [Dehalococcoidales bacterium]